MKKFASLVAAALLGATFTLGIFHFFLRNDNNIRIEHAPVAIASKLASNSGQVLDFTFAAEKAMPAVVHIRATSKGTPYSNKQNDIFQFFFEDSPQRPNYQQPREGTGSGVIISGNGYIVTNNHVVDKADELEVTLHDNRTFKAKVVGTDPSTDLAVIKIEGNDLSYLALVNSDEVKVGEWVLAVGNPFNLTSTVTAGIVSAKGRNIHILDDRSAIESFIQTDAAVNPGNSGGALINTDGNLVGINTAIASPTGAYAGYSFSIPSNIVSKVVDDLIKHGVVQRGYLGVMIRSVDGNFAKENDLTVTEGVYVDSLIENSAAHIAGIQKGDVIIKVDEVSVKSSSELQEAVGRHRPGDKLTLSVLRSHKEKTFDVVLRNQQGNTELVKKESVNVVNMMGADFETVPKSVAKKLNISGGVQVKNLKGGKLSKMTSMEEGFIITKINGKPVSSTEDMVDILDGFSGGVMLEGVYPSYSGVYYYAFGM